MNIKYKNEIKIFNDFILHNFLLEDLDILFLLTFEVF